jgi:hypothetical protein
MSEEQGRPFVRYHDFTPATIEYDHELDAYTVGRADIDSFDRRHHLTLIVVVTGPGSSRRSARAAPWSSGSSGSTRRRQPS